MRARRTHFWCHTAAMRTSLFFAFASLAACGGVIGSGSDAATTDSSSSPDAASSMNGVVLRTCGPTDAIVPAFVFSSAPLTCSAPSVPDDTITITLDNPLTGPATIHLDSGPLEISGTSSVCTIAGCTEALSGTLDVTAFDAQAAQASGSYTLDMPNGTVLGGAFTNIPICDNVVTCG